MGRAILIASGKGGVGKTTITANLGIALAKLGKMVCVVDADLSLNNLDVALGLENRIVYDLLDVIQGKCRISNALVEDPYLEGLYLLPSVKESAGKKIKGQDFNTLIKNLKSVFDYVLIDAPAGMDNWLEQIVPASNEVIIVVTPTISSLRDAKKLINWLKVQSIEEITFALNRVRSELVKSGAMVNLEEVKDLLEVLPSGIIPENDNLLLNNSFASLMHFKDLNIYEPFNIFAQNINDGTSVMYDYLKKHNSFWGIIKNSFKNIG